MAVVSEAFVNSYSDMLYHTLQQKGSKLRGAVNYKSQKSEYDYYDRINPGEAHEITGRFQDTQVDDPDHDKRRCQIRPYAKATYLDWADKNRLNLDPTSDYSQVIVNALSRKQDAVIVASFDATVTTGKTGSTTVAFPTGANGQEIAVGSTNLSVPKLLNALILLEQEDGGDDSDQLFVACTRSNIAALLNEQEVSSADYNTVKALSQGQIDTYMGFKFITMGDKLLPKTSNTRSVYAWRKSGVVFAEGQGISTTIDRRPDKNNSIQIYGSIDCGAVRMEEKKIVRILCDESAAIT